MAVVISVTVLSQDPERRIVTWKRRSENQLLWDTLFLADSWRLGVQSDGPRGRRAVGARSAIAAAIYTTRGALGASKSVPMSSIAFFELLPVVFLRVDVRLCLTRPF